MKPKPMKAMKPAKPRQPRLIRASAALFLAPFAFAFACGETRKGPGEECLRSDDCLSGFCSARTCVAAPPTGTPPQAPPDASAVADAGTSATDATVADAGAE
jgi:hypothetical protein